MIPRPLLASASARARLEGFGRSADGEVGCREEPGEAVHEHEVRDALGVGGREGQRHEPAADVR